MHPHRYVEVFDKDLCLFGGLGDPVYGRDTKWLRQFSYRLLLRSRRRRGGAWNANRLFGFSGFLLIVLRIFWSFNDFPPDFMDLYRLSSGFSGFLLILLWIFWIVTDCPPDFLDFY